ncbi:hypothetical protein [Virgisporangium aurantiacum]|uniref:Uncharacterized protein n=1 Tax=Virgisporangium aurantiacum TaxID=175570 RepID=A0A8J3Z411_9ACTN|nr:hypothetical protein [Virgisporangium aurantiacum]GIJ54861.1 hypothetical protein Vau01_023770 [Virgisporangium aurantiacum]
MLQALTAVPVHDPAAMLAAGARALDEDGDLTAARRFFDAAYTTAERDDRPDAMAEAALGLAGLWVHEQRTGVASALVESRLRWALARVGFDSPLAGRIRVRLAGEADYRAGTSAGILAALAAARSGDDPVATADALNLAHHCLLGPEHAAARHALAVDLIGTSARTGRRRDLLMGLLWQTVNRFLDGDRHAERRLAELRALLANDDHLAIGFVVAAMDVMLLLRAGRFDDAEAAATACARRGHEAGDVDATGWFGAQLVAIRWYQGRLGDLRPMLDDLVHSSTLSAVDNACFAAQAVAAALTGDPAAGSDALARLRGRDLADLPRSSSWLGTMVGAAEAAYLLGDADTAATVYDLLAPFADRPAVTGLGVACYGSVHHALGTAALTTAGLTTGAADRAVTHFAAAVAANRALGHRPATVHSRWRHATALTLRGGPDDYALARRERETAAAAAAALGMAPTTGDAETAAVEPLRLSRQEKRWRIDWGRRSVVVDARVGMLHLAVLLANPNTDVAAVDLAAGVSGLASAAGAGMSDQPVLDDAARRQYQRRIAHLRADIDASTARGEHRRADRARDEHDRLATALTGALGVDGRSRRFTDNAERARVAVGKAIRRAIDRVAEVDHPIAQHLRNTVHTGLRCSYRPE